MCDDTFKFSEGFVSSVMEFFGRDMPPALRDALESHSFGKVKQVLGFEKEKPYGLPFGTPHRKQRLQALYQRCIDEWRCHKGKPSTAAA